MKGITLETNKIYTDKELDKYNKEYGTINNICELINKGCVLSCLDEDKKAEFLLKTVNEIKKDDLLKILDEIISNSDRLEGEIYKNKIKEIKELVEKLNNPDITYHILKRDENTPSYNITMYKFSTYKKRYLIPHYMLNLASELKIDTLALIYKKLALKTDTISIFIKEQEKEEIYIKLENADIILTETRSR